MKYVNIYEGKDHLCVVLAAMGYSDRLITSKTGLTTGQISYRTRKHANIRRSDYRNGYSGVAKAVLRIAMDSADKVLSRELEKGGMTPNEAIFSREPDLNLEWGPVEISGKIPFLVQTAMRAEEAHELEKLAKGKDVLEIGGAHGYSAIVMALAGAKRVVSVDDHNGGTQLGDTLRIMTNNVIAFGVSDKVELMIAHSKTAMLQLLADGQSFDFVFLDGGQEYDELCTEIALGLCLIAGPPLGTIAIHDYGHPAYPDKRRAVDRFFPQGADRLVTTLFVKHI